MGNALQARQANEPACSFHRMDETENRVQNIFVTGILLKLNKTRFDRINALGRFDQKIFGGFRNLVQRG
jgi:hypothetical protein